ncbi:hypothetical protein H1D32_03075 [Anaerobacillus sp. CMMVII]|uniref:VLRF1 family aeRF1-type release factor n=1 Tax=Anaerobacillus sp. CMMVII TaxID=2755588 RepID=UPI0021B84B08|nr:VLRF1 family aeRF1-type release factor [Anaerobacillus sp. CMMVII]MCT8136827.1 hypothetical protein [Anaerobacillus sp. CMMVII]
MGLQNVVEKLRSNEYKGSVLTIYLNTDRGECQNSSWKIRLKNGLKRLEEYVALSYGEKERKRLKKLTKKVEKTIYDARTNLQKSVVIFASEEDKLFSVHYLQVSVENEFFFEGSPELSQIEKIQKNYERSGVIIANEAEIILMHSELGDLEVINKFEFEAYTDDWRLFEGTTASERMGTRANHRDHYQERYEANQQRWLRSIISVIEKSASQQKWSHVHIIGQANYLALLENELNIPIKNVLRKTVSTINQKKVINREILAI